MEKPKLSPPWITYVNEMKALFGKDPEIKIEYDEENNNVKLFVDNQNKADALTAMLPAVKEFGNVKLMITVIPANTETNFGSVITVAFRGNPAFSDLIDVVTPFGDVTYAMFARDIVQFYNDQMDDPYGNKTMLYQDIAKDVFGELPGCFFCTDVKN